MSKNIDHHLQCFLLFTVSGVFRIGQLYSVSHIDGERTRGDILGKGKGNGASRWGSCVRG